MLKRGSVIADKYVIREPLGKGGSSSVFLAEGMENGKQYTIKVSTEKELLRQEAELLGKICSRYFQSVKDYIEDQERAYLVLTYLEGASLQQLLDGGRHFSETEIGEIMEQVTAALTELHYRKQPMVHLDLKPANILLDTTGVVHMIDLGAGGIVGEKKIQKGGTYGYAAPEQFWRGAHVGAAADVYACGKLLAYLFTGKDPAKPPYDMELRLLRSSGCKKGWQILIEKCLKTEAGSRYPDAGILHKEIRRLQQEGSKKGTAKQAADIIYRKCIWKSDYERK